MSKVLNCQVSLFGHIEIKPEIVKINKYMTSLAEATKLDFMPNVINSQRIEFPDKW